MAAVDLELDGDLDLVVVNGGVKRASAADDTGADDFWSAYAERNQVFLNRGNGTFTEGGATVAAFQQPREVSRGLVTGDIDNDGDLDLLVTNTAGRARLFRNEFVRQGNWLTVRAIDPALRRDCPGARVSVLIGERQFARDVNPASSYLSSHDLRLHFGLGQADRFDAIVVHWPGAGEQVERFPAGPANRHLVLQRGTGQVTNVERQEPQVEGRAK